MVILASILGVCLNAWYLRESELAPIAWSILPYVIAGALSLAAKTQPATSILLGAVLVMLFFDGWLVIETALGTKSPFLLAVSLVSTLKLFAAFPLGALIGYLLYKVLSK